MWATVLILGVAVMFEPVRIAFAVFMVKRPRPFSQLLAFFCGGLITGVGGGLIVLFVLRATPLGAGKFGVAKVHMVIGVVALLVAVVLATNVSARTVMRRTPVGTAVGSDAGAIALAPKPPSALERLSVRTRDILQGTSLWTAGASGLVVWPSYNFTAALAVILGSGAAPATQAGALLAFNLVACVALGTPLVIALSAPDKIRAVMAALHAWLRSRSRRDVAALLAAAGSVILTIGVMGF